ncbi:hypothetical protein [Pseudoclavibacter helvolus]|uniref:hypothetical protein n=1 Tax=Pseudoclavibacter helvolus TaxID=255205 RepID=UPI003C747166
MKNKKVWAALAVAGIAGAGLAGCASGGGAGESPTATAESLLTALADGDVEQVQTLTGLEADDEMLALLPQATEKIAGVEILTSDPENVDELTEVDVSVAYTLGGERFEDSIRVSRQGEDGQTTWVASAPTASLAASSRSAFSVGDAEAAPTFNLLPGVYPVSMDAPYVDLDVSEAVVGTQASGSAVELPVALDEDSFLPAAQAAAAEAIATCLSDYEPNRVTPQCGGSYASSLMGTGSMTFTVEGEVPELNIAQESAGGAQLPVVKLTTGGTVTILKQSSSSMSNFGIDSSSSSTLTPGLNVEVTLLPSGTEFASIKVTD